MGQLSGTENSGSHFCAAGTTRFMTVGSPPHVAKRSTSTPRQNVIVIRTPIGGLGTDIADSVGVVLALEIPQRMDEGNF